MEHTANYPPLLDGSSNDDSNTCDDELFMDLAIPPLEELEERPFFESIAKRGLEYQSVSCIQFALSSDMQNGTVTCKPQQWSAILSIYTTDVERLMRRHFDWSSWNIAREFSSTQHEIPWRLHQFQHGPKSDTLGFSVSRMMLEDISGPDCLEDTYECHWTGTLMLSVDGRDRHLLDNFDLKQLTHEKICFCEAVDADDNVLYQYVPLDPQRTNQNYIFGNSWPLFGFWPWLRVPSHPPRNNKRPAPDNAMVTAMAEERRRIVVRTMNAAIAQERRRIVVRTMNAAIAQERCRILVRTMRGVLANYIMAVYTDIFKAFALFNAERR